MKKFFKGLFLLILILALIGVGLIFTVRPDNPNQYTLVKEQPQLQDIISGAELGVMDGLRLSFSETLLNQIFSNGILQSLNENPKAGVEFNGSRLYIQQEILHVGASLEYYRIPIGLDAIANVDVEGDEVVITFTDIQVGALTLPDSIYNRIIDTEEYRFPRKMEMFTIDSFDFVNDQLVVYFSIEADQLLQQFTNK
ncbi:hypothetical protein SANA_30610 [Gottschalkiaceae bacterium SANA]|nr:hypothetical protein SANA_30610 [Gottschalkiaceae bacterium SANA]